MKVNLLVEFNREKRIPNCTNFHKHPSESIHMSLKYKRYTHKCHIPDKCKKEKVTICDY